MTKFRTRLLIALISLIGVVLIGLGLLLGQLFKTYYLNSFYDNLKKETFLLKNYIEDQGGFANFDEKKALELSKTLEARISLTDVEGRILYDSGLMTDWGFYQHQEVIKEAISKKPKKENRIEVAGKDELHYYWSPVMKDGKQEGYLILSSQKSLLNKVYSKIWWLLIVSLGFALILIILLGSRITARYTKPIESATNVAIELAKGNYWARTFEDRMDETGMLSSSINILARNLQEMVKAQEMQQDRLSTLIENMGSGLILIDSRGYINLINRGYINIFKVYSSDYLYQLYYDVIEHKEVTEIIEEIFMTEQKVSKQLHLPISIERRYFDVYGVPIIGNNNVWKGVLLVFHDITELKKLEQMRKDFVANVSHELNTPITSIKGFSETLLDGAMEDRGTLEAFLSIILKESDRLQSLVQDLLDLSKIEQQGFELNIVKVDLIPTVNHVMAILGGKAVEKQIKLELHAEEEHVYIEGDVHRLKQILINLINNAISYTLPDGVVSVSIMRKGKKVRISVKDSGIGIEKTEISRIFERFYRIDRARARNSGGTGLGLAIVKHLVEAHKGNISVKSEVGKGSEFLIEFHQSFPMKKH
ncbi:MULTISPECIES: two-component system histidine kinase PnpS [unclassified Bacillus (in: firmicutes)]|uniref:two-component system histidine kinase PnpS n=1 Tax=unclassified Bacillus (in: firmicutes) TaxID=185979 RepID=UPI0008F2E9B6|nr:MULTISPECIES: ATP-binding protein [unclassified Bacillus (in: firmicutes)]SFB17243.1 two-component system, OmpR family, phosphate regulon sensor histidine kinase PhoR [Bacillus sp. UNCCL13]SFQ77366.1 two-component system, OmpR family, phosphate regulon sensor histidine kinase PhoR [Bacillus sp. cl95]